MPEPLLRDRFQSHHVGGALLDGRAVCVSHVTPAGQAAQATVERIGALIVEADRLRWLTWAEALATGRVACKQYGGSPHGLG